MKKKKKILKIILGIFAVLILVVIGLVIWQWESLNIMLKNAKLSGPVNAVPEVKTPISLPITKGESDWICWRGKNMDGRSKMTNIPKDWSKGLKKEWEINYLCQGRVSSVWSAPVIQGNRLIVCGRDEANDLVFCLNSLDGSLIWQSSYPAEAGASYGTGSRATPWIDNGRVFTFGRSGDLVCWNLENGDKTWHRKVTEAGGVEPKWGFSSSPLIIDDLVVVSGGGTARTIAYNKTTGEVKWKSGNGKAGYAAIQSMQLDERKVILSFHGKGLSAIAPEDGSELWNYAWATKYDVNATTPISEGNKVFITSGYNTGCTLLNVDSSKADPVWKNKIIASHHSDPFIIDGHIYGYSGLSAQNKGKFKCIELTSGDEKWSTRDMGWAGEVYFSHPYARSPRKNQWGCLDRSGTG